MQPKPWSISALDKFVNCPKQYAEIKIYKRVTDTEGEGAMYGNYIHEHFEKYLLAPATYALPVDNPAHLAGLRPPAYYRDYLDALLRLPGTPYVELEMALDKTLSPCDYFASDVWVRGKCDFFSIHGEIGYGIDHKTGKRKPSRQMVLMALLLFYHFPLVQKVHTKFCWLKTGEQDNECFVRADIPSMWNQYVTDLKQYAMAHHTETWQPRQSGLCHGWCPVTTCEFWQPKRPQRR